MRLIFLFFFTSVLIDFRRNSGAKVRPKLTFFRLGSAKPNFAKSSIFFRFLKDCRVSELREYVEKRLQNEAGLSTRFGPRLGTVFGRFWRPKTGRKAVRRRTCWDFEKARFCEAIQIARTSPELAGSQRTSEVWDYVFVSRSD